MKVELRAKAEEVEKEMQGLNKLVKDGRKLCYAVNTPLQRLSV